MVIGKTVPDISLNAVANLGYAEFRWGVPVYPGDTLSARSTVLGLRENSNKASGVVWVRSTGVNQTGEMVLDYVRWVMVHKRDPQGAGAADHRAEDGAVGEAGGSHRAEGLARSPATTMARPARPIAGKTMRPGERIDHVSGITLEDSDHMFSTRLYQNTARCISTPSPARTRASAAASPMAAT